MEYPNVIPGGTGQTVPASPASRLPPASGFRLRVSLSRLSGYRLSRLSGYRRRITPILYPGAARHEALHHSRKFTSAVAMTVMGCPFLLPGLNRHLVTASIAFSSRPLPSGGPNRWIFFALDRKSTRL